MLGGKKKEKKNIALDARSVIKDERHKRKHVEERTAWEKKAQSGEIERKQLERRDAFKRK